MFFRHSADNLILPLLVGTILIIISYRPAYHLCPDMLRGFFLAKLHVAQPAFLNKGLRMLIGIVH